MFLWVLSIAQRTNSLPSGFPSISDSEGRTRGCERPVHWVASPSPGPPFSLQMVIGVGLLDRGEKRARRVPEKGVSGKVYKSDPSLAL